MGAVGKKAGEPVAGLGDRVGPYDADYVKATVARGLAERGLQCFRLYQKSRSA
jgi:hypothetical protein